MKRFTFDIGNSNTGGVGMVLEVEAESAEEAVEKVHEIEDVGVVGDWIGDCFVADLPTVQPGVRLSLCFNPANISAKDLTETEEMAEAVVG